MVKTRNIKSLMIKHNLQNTDMAQMLELSESSFSQKLTGKYDFTETEINKILVLFGKTYEEIFLKSSSSI